MSWPPVGLFGSTPSARLTALIMGADQSTAPASAPRLMLSLREISLRNIDLSSDVIEFLRLRPLKDKLRVI
jgi:hypothetical protein